MLVLTLKELVIIKEKISRKPTRHSSWGYHWNRLDLFKIFLSEFLEIIYCLPHSLSIIKKHFILELIVGMGTVICRSFIRYLA